MSHVFSLSHCPIIALPCPILSSFHCVCVKRLVPLLGQCTGMPAWKAPGESAFWTPLVLLVWCSASLCCWDSLSGTPGGPLLQTLLTTMFEPPVLLTPLILWALLSCSTASPVYSFCGRRQMACIHDSSLSRAVTWRERELVMGQGFPPLL